MSFARPHAPAADATFSAAGAAAWDANQTPTGADVGGIPYCPTATTETTSADFTFNGTTLSVPSVTMSTLTAGRVALVGTSGVITDDAGLTYDTSTDVLTVGALLRLPQSSSGGVTFGTGSNEARIFENFNASLYFGFGSGNPTHMAMDASGFYLRSGGRIAFSTSNTDPYAAQSGIGGPTANKTIFGGSSVADGGVTTETTIRKAVASIADNTATTVFTVTVPNAAHSASIRVRLTGSMGAGGAIGANESTQDAEYMINVARTAGVNAVATIGAVVGQAAAAAVAGAGTVAVSGTLGAVSGAVGATNTFTIQVTIARSGSGSTNHTCFGYAELLNANATGVTIA